MYIKSKGKRSFISIVRPSVHTNSSRKRSFSKRLFKPEGNENTDFSFWTAPGGEGGHSLIWAIRGRAAGQGMVFWPRCPKQGIQFDLPLPYTRSEPVLNWVWYYEPRDFNPECEQNLMVFCLI